jgi:hypothetical protein
MHASELNALVELPVDEKDVKKCVERIYAHFEAMAKEGETSAPSHIIERLCREAGVICTIKIEMAVRAELKELGFRFKDYAECGERISYIEKIFLTLTFPLRVIAAILAFIVMFMVGVVCSLRDMIEGDYKEFCGEWDVVWYAYGDIWKYLVHGKKKI